MGANLCGANKLYNISDPGDVTLVEKKIVLTVQGAGVEVVNGDYYVRSFSLPVPGSWSRTRVFRCVTSSPLLSSQHTSVRVPRTGHAF